MVTQKRPEFHHYLQVKEVVARLRKHEHTIFLCIAERRFPHAKWVSDGYLIPEADVEAMLKPIEGD